MTTQPANTGRHYQKGDKMRKIIESELFDIILTEHKDYKGTAVYRLCYGLQVDTFNCLREAMNNFKGCLEHALDCNSI